MKDELRSRFSPGAVGNGLFFDVETDFFVRPWRWWGHQLADRLEKGMDALAEVGEQSGEGG